jgi:hypothetical protein
MGNPLFMKIMEVMVTKIPWGGTNFLSDQNQNYYTFFHKYVVLFIFLLVWRALYDQRAL